MQELVRTNNAVLITAIEALLKGAEIPHIVLDRNMSVLEGSLGILPCRVLVDDGHRHAARQLLADAGLGHELRPLPPGQEPEHTDDAVLGGRLRLTQKKSGHRIGHDAILLAAATAAKSGDLVADCGAGIGAAGLVLACRVPGVDVTLIERDAELASIAAGNIARNGFADRVRAIALDVTAPAGDFAAAGLAPGSFDGVMMNPPFNSPRQQVSPDPARRAAHEAADGTLEAWIAAASGLLHSAGALTMIWRADGLGQVLEALEQGQFGGVAVLPVHGRAGQPAIRVLVRAEKGSRAPLSLLPGLDLNDPSGRPSAAAEDVLRHAKALQL